MKTFRLSFIGAIMASILVIAACQRSSHQEIISTNNAAKPTAVTEQQSGGTSRQRPHTGTCDPYAYTVNLESRTLVNGNWEWVWSVLNTNPGNGSNGTVQDLSHWGMQFGTCFLWTSVVGAAYSANGSNWTSFSPSFQTDLSQGCMTTPVLKFDFGTSGGAMSYYKLVVNANYDIEMVPAYYKSGAITGCCTFQFEGIGCVVLTEPK